MGPFEEERCLEKLEAPMAKKEKMIPLKELMPAPGAVKPILYGFGKQQETLRETYVYSLVCEDVITGAWKGRKKTTMLPGRCWSLAAFTAGCSLEKDFPAAGTTASWALPGCWCRDGNQKQVLLRILRNDIETFKKSMWNGKEQVKKNECKISGAWLQGF